MSKLRAALFISMVVAFSFVGICEAAWVHDTATEAAEAVATCDQFSGTHDYGKYETTLSASGTSVEAEAKATTRDPDEIVGDWRIYKATGVKTIAWKWDDPETDPTEVCFELKWTADTDGSTSCDTDGWWTKHQAQAWHFSTAAMNSNIESTSLEWCAASNSMIDLRLVTPEPDNNHNEPNALRVSDAVIDIITIAGGWSTGVAEAASSALKGIYQVYTTNHSSDRSGTGGEVGPEDLQSIENRDIGARRSSFTYATATHRAKVRIKFGGPDGLGEDNDDAYAFARATASSSSFNLYCYP